MNEFINHREDCSGIIKDDLVTCAVCSEQLDKTKWASHKKKKHNNLTWRVGDPPLVSLVRFAILLLKAVQKFNHKSLTLFVRSGVSKQCAKAQYLRYY